MPFDFRHPEDMVLSPAGVAAGGGLLRLAEVRSRLGHRALRALLRAAGRRNRLDRLPALQESRC